MQETAANPPSHAGPRARRRNVLLLVVALSGFAAVGLRWLWLNRLGLPLDIDEAGYQVIALGDFTGLTDAGIVGWVEAVLAPSIQAPLMTAATTPVFLVLGPGSFTALLVPLGFALVALVATYALGRVVGGRRTAWLALAAAAAAPLVIAYSRTYNFAIASAATAAVALWALGRSAGLTDRRWSLVAGVAVGLLALSRTMSLALLPAFLLAGLVLVAVGPHRRTRLANGAVAAAAGLVVAAPWYLRNGRMVLDYLFSFGYGSRSTEYGSDESVLSASSWLTTLRYTVLDVGLPLTALVVLCLLLLAGAGARALAGGSPGHGGRLRRLGSHPLLPSALLLLWGALVLTSSGNKGSGFLAPLVPAAAVLVAYAVATAPRPLNRVLTVSLVAMLALNTYVSSDPAVPGAARVVVDVPVLGPSLVTNGEGTIQRYVADGFADPASPDPIPTQRMRRWSAEVRTTAARLDAAGATGSVTVFGFRHRLLNVNSVQLQQVLADRRPFPALQVSPVDTPTRSSLEAWLSSGDASVACRLLVSPGRRLEFTPLVDTRALRGAAAAAGFARTSAWTLPDGRRVAVWTRAATCPSPPSPPSSPSPPSTPTG